MLAKSIFEITSAEKITRDKLKYQRVFISMQVNDASPVQNGNGLPVVDIIEKMGDKMQLLTTIGTNGM